MFRYANPFMLSLTLLCFAPAASAEDVSTIVDKVKAVVTERTPCWKLYHQQERTDGDRTTVDVNWVCGKEGVSAYLYQVPSVEAAVKLLDEIRTSPVQSLTVARGAPPLDSYQFGDESFVRSYLLYSSSSYVFFRKGNIVVRIDSGTTGKASSKCTLRNAVRFALLFVERMPPLNNSLNQTANPYGCGSFPCEQWPASFPAIESFFVLRHGARLDAQNPLSFLGVEALYFSHSTKLRFS